MSRSLHMPELAPTEKAQGHPAPLDSGVLFLKGVLVLLAGSLGYSYPLGRRG